MSRRHRAREMALQMLYQGDLGGAALAEVFEGFRPTEPADGGSADRVGTSREQEEAEIFAHARGLVDGTIEHLEEVDGMISSQAENWRLERMPGVDRNILRLAVYEFLYQIDVPKLVVIDEAIELAKRFGSENSSSFVNGLLDGLLKKHSFPGTVT